MAVDMFWKIDGIKGESKKDGHKDEIDIYSYSWGISNASSFQHGSGGGVGKANFGDFSLTKKVDKSSNALAEASASGKHIKEASVFMRKAGEKPLEYLVFKFSDILITGVQQSAGGESDAMESVSFAYGKVVFDYKMQKADGTADGAANFTWNISEHKKG